MCSSLVRDDAALPLIPINSDPSCSTISALLLIWPPLLDGLSDAYFNPPSAARFCPWGTIFNIICARNRDNQNRFLLHLPDSVHFRCYSSSSSFSLHSYSIDRSSFLYNYCFSRIAAAIHPTHESTSTWYRPCLVSYGFSTCSTRNFFVNVHRSVPSSSFFLSQSGIAKLKLGPQCVPFPPNFRACSLRSGEWIHTIHACSDILS